MMWLVSYKAKLLCTSLTVMQWILTRSPSIAIFICFFLSPTPVAQACKAVSVVSQCVLSKARENALLTRGSTAEALCWSLDDCQCGASERSDMKNPALLLLFLFSQAVTGAGTLLNIQIITQLSRGQLICCIYKYIYILICFLSVPGERRC